MDIFGKKKLQGELQETKGQLEEIKTSLLDTQLELQESILSWSGISDTTYKGNDYNTYDKAVTEIDKKYRGTANWGVWAGNIIDVRSAFIIGRGLRVVKTEDDAMEEAEWSDEWMKYNNLEISLPIIYSNEAEIEGKFLGKLIPEDESTLKQKGPDGKDLSYMIKTRFISYRDTKYKVIAHPNDYLEYVMVEYNLNGKNDILEQREFVYKKFGGSITDPNSATPKLQRSLTQIDEVDKAYRDLRKMNWLFASPTPYFKFEDKKDAKEFQEQIINWRIGKRIATTANFSYVGPDMAHSGNLEKEVMMKLKSISGNTGVPVHFLGLPELMSNRSTADNLMELIWASTRSEREIWESAYTELLRKAIIMRNEIVKVKLLDPMKVKVEIPEISGADWDHLQNVYLPLYREGAISLHLLLSKIPNINIEEEEARLEEQEEKEYKDFENRKNDALLQQEEENNLNKNEESKNG